MYCIKKDQRGNLPEDDQDYRVYGNQDSDKYSELEFAVKACFNQPDTCDMGQTMRIMNSGQ